MKKSLIMLGMLGVAFTYAQETSSTTTPDTTGKVGINTETPYATLDVVAKKSDGSTIEGFRTPQLTGDALQKMTAELTANNDGLVVYVTSAVTTPDATTKKVTFPGYYRFTFKTNEGGLDYTKTSEAITKALQGNFLYAEKSWVRLEPTGLEVISNPNNSAKVGRRLVGANPENYGDIGLLAVDMSHQTGTWTKKVGEETVKILGGATGDYSLATGLNNLAEGEHSAAFGYQNYAQSTRSVVFGNNTKVTVSRTVEGNDGIAKSRNSVAMGQNTEILDSPNSFGFGANGKITNSQNAFVGGANGSETTTAYDGSSVNYTYNDPNEVYLGNSSSALGSGVKVRGHGSIGMGSLVQVNGQNSVALGRNARIGKLVFDYTKTAENENKYDRTIAATAGTATNYAIAIGTNTSVTGNYGVAIGDNANVTGGYGVAIGKSATAGASEVAIGSDSTNVILGKLKSEGGGVGGSCTVKGRIVFNGTDFLGCTGAGKWEKLNN